MFPNKMVYLDGPTGGSLPQGAGSGDQPGGTSGQGGAGNQGAQPGGTGGTADQFKLKHGGQEKDYTREAMTNLAQIGLDSQANAQAKEAEYAKRTKNMEIAEQQLRAMIAELEKSGKAEEGTEEQKTLKALQAKVDSLTAAQGKSELDRALGPVKAKYPDQDEKLVLRTFLNKLDSGEIEDTEENLMKVAEDLSKGRGEWFDTSLKKLTENPDDPRMKAYNEKLITDYISGKRRLANAGGETGGAGAGGAASEQKPKSIAEGAARVRAIPNVP